MSTAVYASQLLILGGEALAGLEKQLRKGNLRAIFTRLENLGILTPRLRDGTPLPGLKNGNGCDSADGEIDAQVSKNVSPRALRSGRASDADFARTRM